MENKNYIWRPVSEYTGGRVLATNDLDVLIGEINSEGDCESEEGGSTILCGITGFIKIEEMLPELKESEGEKIRKEIVKFIITTPKERNNHKKWLAWLEKQGEKDEEILILKDQIESLHAAIKAIKETHRIELEKQGEQILANSAKTCKDEQKPADKVEPKFKVGDIVKHKDNPHLTYILKRFTDDGDYEFHAIGKDGTEGGTCFSVVKYQDKWELVEQKPAWSEEDEKMLSKCREAVSIYFAPEDKWEVKDWLKYLKERVQSQPKQVWSEEDEKDFNTAIQHIENYVNNTPSSQRPEIWADITKLKSLRPQSQWNPSDKQIEALDFATDCIVPAEFCFKRKELKGLLEQLKKLREE